MKTKYHYQSPVFPLKEETPTNLLEETPTPNKSHFFEFIATEKRSSGSAVKNNNLLKIKLAITVENFRFNQLINGYYPCLKTYRSLNIFTTTVMKAWNLPC